MKEDFPVVITTDGVNHPEKKAKMSNMQTSLQHRNSVSTYQCQRSFNSFKTFVRLTALVNKSTLFVSGLNEKTTYPRQIAPETLPETSSCSGKVDGCDVS